MATYHWYLSCPKFTVSVHTVGDGPPPQRYAGSNPRGGRITFTAPITRKFVGQPLDDLYNWAYRRFGDVELVRI